MTDLKQSADCGAEPSMLREIGRVCPGATRPVAFMSAVILRACPSCRSPSRNPALKNCIICDAPLLPPEPHCHQVEAVIPDAAIPPVARALYRIGLWLGRIANRLKGGRNAR